MVSTGTDLLKRPIAAREPVLVMQTASLPPTQDALSQSSDVQYVLNIDNNGEGVSENVQLQLNSSAGLTYLTVAGAACNSCATPNNWLLDIPDIASGASQLITITAQLDSDLTRLTHVTTTVQMQTDLVLPQVETMAHVLDLAIPTLEIARQPGNTVAAGPQTFVGTVDDAFGTGVALVEVSLDGTSWLTATGAQSWSTELDAGVATGSWNLYVRATDYHGQVSDIEVVTFVIDEVAPLITPTVPAVAGNALIAPLSGTTTDPLPLGAQVRDVAVQFDSNTAVWQDGAVYTPDGNGVQPWQYVWALPTEDWVTHTVRFRATDYGENATTTGWFTTVVDTVAPTITVTQQLTQVVEGGSNLALAGLVTDGGGVQTATMVIYPPVGGPISETVTVNNGQWSYVLNQPLGQYTLLLTIVDTVGNSRLIGPFAVAVVSNSAPTAVDDSTMTDEDIAIPIDVLSNDNDVDGDGLIVDSVTQGSNGSVVNNGSDMATVTVMVAVVNTAPVAAVGGPYVVNEGDSVVLDASGTTDGEQKPATLSYAWDFDEDGEYDDATGIIPTFSALTLDGPMSVTVALQVTDGGGLLGMDTAVINILNLPPTITNMTYLPIIFGEGTTITVLAHDPLDPLSYAFDCDDDGSFEVGPQAGNSATCSFTSPGNFNVNVQVSDDDGGIVTDTTLVTVVSQQQAVGNLQADVQALVDAGILNQGQGRGLRRDLSSVIKKLNQGKPQEAVNKLTEFVAQVNEFILDDVLTTEQGQPLIDAANRLIAAIE